MSVICRKIDTLFFTLSEDFKSEIQIQELVSRLTVYENGISIYQNPNLGVDNQKQIKLKIEDVTIVYCLLIYILLESTS